MSESSHDEMSEGTNTNLDATFIVEDNDYDAINYNGIDEGSSTDFNIASTLTLKKNLTEAFDKHAGLGEEKYIGRDMEEKRGKVKAKIQAFEQNNKKAKGNNGNRIKQRVRFENERPPTAPLPVPGASFGSHNALSVYLRVRPPTAPKETSSANHEATYNTVEIVEPNCEEACYKKIRTYPPKESNASKVVRGQHHLHSHSANTDLIFAKKNSSAGAESSVRGVKEFDFCEVFGPQSSQNELYDKIAAPLVDGLFPTDKIKLAGDKSIGKSALLFSYGITNAGKTYTIMGEEAKLEEGGKDKATLNLSENHGFIPRTIQQILDTIDELNGSAEIGNTSYALKMSYFEIYNEQVYDLLPKKSSAPASKYVGAVGENPLKIRESGSGRVYVKGLAKHHVTSLSQGLDLAHDAKMKRHTSSNNINSDSSRSHSICQFEVVAFQSDRVAKGRDSASVASQESGYATDDDSTISDSSNSVTFWVVDLAGSERSKRTGQYVGSARQKEARLINSSLMKLMRCFAALKDNQASAKASCVPFRESKLTHLFMGHLTGSSSFRTSMVVNINPSVADFDETQHVLSYATIAKSIQIDQAEYSKKSEAIQLIGVKHIHTHNANGRPLKKRAKSPPRKIAKIVKKLSPRAVLKRRQEQKQKSMLDKRREGLKKLRGVTIVATKKERHGKSKQRVAGNKRKSEDEVNGLMEQLEVARQNAERHEHESKLFKQKLSDCEAEIRGELAEETETQFRKIREQHDAIVIRLKHQIQNASNTPSKSAKKARIDKADQVIDDLLDKVDECEEEMSRMSEEHRQQVDHINAMLVEREERISSIEAEHIDDVTEIRRLQDKLKEKNINLEQITRHRDELEEKLNELEDNSLILGERRESPEKENQYKGRSTPSSTPRLRRLPRGRCSEVACADVSPPKDEPTTSSKKHRGLRLNRSKQNAKSPLKDDAVNTCKENNDDIAYPNSQPDFDEITGLYLRPRGRAPSGRCWDSETGGWRLAA
uniref:Kinesin motor domain-containing protein n=1 Tax=Chaetoceros debilis TaxID=122233 RepID=A0A7S3PYE2_9STRA|mmetsp:Transcript_29082/g.44392  ORF Transcript_29082/g.44392 Transcript_29082/m.44392 type:complete len:998 (+) Transcript_29082:173-3166(+)|eukprot:CAMPEP_0194107292 /NCGR_PEP_ID=MMETSP0150-20130528/7173_1 /TAXON_ID=122233 /ORGANISM="Chaetoceros debilis, Strain MM31A-1" /LENGTH=997 /DNA_ID=CAMNT_0038795643 /DNA_START=30 /DNA_END=3023 /DNA_ORIENTATION=-